VGPIEGLVYKIGVVIVKGEGAVLGVNFGRPIVTNGDGNVLFPNYFGEDLFNVLKKIYPQWRQY